MAFVVTTPDRVRALMADTGQAPTQAVTDLLGTFIATVTTATAQYLGYSLEKAALVEAIGRVQPFQTRIVLARPPVDAAQTFEIRVDETRVFDGDPLEADAYVLDAASGQIFLDEPLDGPARGTVQVTYTGGLAAVGVDDEATVTALEAVAAPIVEGANWWVANLFTRRKSSSKTSRTGGGRGASATFAGPLKMPDVTRELFMPYRRLRAGMAA